MMIKYFIRQFKLFIASIKANIYVQSNFPTAILGKNIEIYNYKKLQLGKKVSIQNNVILHCGGSSWCNYSGSISIGCQSVISSNCVFWGCGANIKIGKNFDCAPGVKIFASRTAYELKIEYPALNPHIFEDVVIGDNVICFSNVVIGPGVIIGNGAVIGANSLVLSDVPENTIVGGSPAKIIRKLNR
jgi:acetyltransferase-like isoleucine patch superfamily enzyme